MSTLLALSFFNPMYTGLPSWLVPINTKADVKEKHVNDLHERVADMAAHESTKGIGSLMSVVNEGKRRSKGKMPLGGPS